MDVRGKQSSKKRLIDADALRSYMDECSKESRFRVYYGYAESFINAAPTVDAVEVVRCRDCKHYLIVDETFCMRRYMCTVNHFSYLENDGDNHFCSYGERKEGAD